MACTRGLWAFRALSIYAVVSWLVSIRGECKAEGRLLLSVEVSRFVEVLLKSRSVQIVISAQTNNVSEVGWAVRLSSLKKRRSKYYLFNYLVL
jgi:hypothetical protein